MSVFQREDSVNSTIEVDLDGEMGNFASLPDHPRLSSANVRQSRRVGVLWLFIFNPILPFVTGSLTTASSLVNATNSTFLPWLVDGHNLGLLHAAMFVVILGIWALVTLSHRKSRARGYLTFYRTTRGIKDAPLLGVGLGNSKLF